MTCEEKKKYCDFSFFARNDVFCDVQQYRSTKIGCQKLYIVARLSELDYLLEFSVAPIFC